MTRTLITLTLLLTALAGAADAPPGPTPDERLQLATLTQQYYKVQSQLTLIAQRANALKAALEQKYNCEYNLDTNVCTPLAQTEKDTPTQ